MVEKKVEKKKPKEVKEPKVFQLNEEEMSTVLELIRASGLVEKAYESDLAVRVARLAASVQAPEAQKEEPQQEEESDEIK